MPIKTTGKLKPQVEEDQKLGELLKDADPKLVEIVLLLNRKIKRIEREFNERSYRRDSY